MKKLTTYLLSTGAIVAATMAFTTVASADITVKSTEAEIVLKKGEEAVSTATFDNLDKALDAVAKAKGDLTITIDKDGYSTSKKFPSKASSITFKADDGNAGTATDSFSITAKAGMALKSNLTLENVSIVGGGAKTKATTSANIALKGTSTLSGFGSLKGGKGEDSTLTFEADQVFDFDVSGFGKIDVAAGQILNLKGVKKIQTGELAVAGTVNIYSVPVQVDTISGNGTIGYYAVTDDKGTTAPSFITVKKPVETAPSKIKLAYFNETSDGATESAFPTGTKVLTISKASDAGAAAGYELNIANNGTSAIGEEGEAGYVPAKAATVDYVFSTVKNKDVYVRPAVFEFTAGSTTEKLALWTDVVDKIQTADGASEDVNYTVKLLADADAEKIKMPKKGTYGTLTISSGVTTSSDTYDFVADTEKAAVTFSTSADAADIQSGTVALYNLKKNNLTPSGLYVKEGETGSEQYFAVASKTENVLTGYDLGDEITAFANNYSTVSAATYSAPASGLVVKLNGSDVTSAVTLATVDGVIYAKATNKYYSATATKENLTYYYKTSSNAWTEPAAKAKLAYQGSLSATGNLILKDLELFCYKPVKNKDKSITKQGVATQISGKYDITLDNVSLYEGNEASTPKITATTLKAVSANKLTLKGGIALTAAKVTGTQLVVPTGDTATINTPSLAFKGDKNADDKSGISADIGAIDLRITDKTGKVLTTNKAKATIEGYSGQFADFTESEKNYVWGFSGKNIIPIEKANAISVDFNTNDNNTDYAFYVDSLKTFATVAANGYKAGTMPDTTDYTVVLAKKPDKLIFPKAGQYKSVTFNKAAGLDSLDLGPQKSLKLTGDLTIGTGVTMKVTKLSGEGTLTYTEVETANQAFVTAVNTLVTKATDGFDAADTVSTELAAATDAMEAADAASTKNGLKYAESENTYTGTIKTTAAAKAKYDAINEAVKFLNVNSTALAGTVTKEVYDAYVALSADAKGFLSKEVKATPGTGEGAATTYSWADKAAQS